MVPLWKKNKKDVTDEELEKFYKDKFSDYEKPFTSLLFKQDIAIFKYLCASSTISFVTNNIIKGEKNME